MPKFATESKWLKHTDLEEGRDHVVTIRQLKHQNLAAPGQEKQERWVVYFDEFDKGLGLNATNGKTLCKLFNSEEMDDWIGKQCVLFVKDDVEFQGDIVSAIRIRPYGPKKPAQGIAATAMLEKLEQATSIKAVMKLMQEISTSGYSEDDADSLVMVANQRMQDLRETKK